MWTIFQQGGPVMWPLLICSICSLAFLLDRLQFWLTYSFRLNKELRVAVLTYIKNGHFDKAKSASENSKDPITRSINEILTYPSHKMESGMDRITTQEVTSMKRFHSALELIVSVAPLLGILGTVTGIIASFQALKGDATNPMLVTAGISEALTATAFGLSIAIFSMVGLFFSSVKAQRIIEEMEVSLSIVEQFYDEE